MKNTVIKLVGRSLIVLALGILLVRSLGSDGATGAGRAEDNLKSTERPRTGDFKTPSSHHRSLAGARDPLKESKSKNLVAGKFEKSPTIEEVEDLAASVTTFSLLQRKVLLSDEEQGRVNVLKKRSDLFPAAKRVLLNPAYAQVNLDPLLDFVFAMLQDEVPGAKDLLLTVLQDPSIEKWQGESAGYELVAEIRAEVMWRLAASSQVQEAEIREILPGPVSIRIWQNVQLWQERNAQESKALASRYAYQVPPSRK